MEAQPTAEDRPDDSPFDLLPGAGGRAAALCLHGLTGTPYEVRPIAEALADAGIRAFGPRLAGHGGTPERLAETPYTAWVEGVRQHYAALAAEADRVFVVGLSLGGLLSLDLAAEADVAGVVSIGAPLALSWPIPQAVPIVKYLMPMLPKRSGSDIRDPAARARHPGLPTMPLKSVHELVRLQRSLSSYLGQITAPALIAHGVHDHTARPADAQKIFDRIGSEDKELLWLENSAHVVPVDYDGPDLAERVAAFIAARL